MLAWRLSEQTRQQAERLQSLPRSGWFGSFPHETPVLLRAIGKSGEVAALPAIVPYLLDRTPEVSDAAAEALHRLLMAVAPADLPALDERIRPGWLNVLTSAEQQYDWHGLTPQRVRSLRRFGQAEAAALGIISFHASGYVRQAALEALSALSGGEELPFLLLRLNDWVANVRTAARSAVYVRLRPEKAAHFVHCLGLILRLREGARDDHAPFLEHVFALLKNPASRSALLEGLESPYPPVRRACLRLAVEAGEWKSEALLERAFRHRDALLRLQAARVVADHADTATLSSLLDRMLRDRFAPVRIEALKVYVERLPEAAPAVLRASLLDPHSAVREMAREQLSRFVAVDYAAFYRSAVETATESTRAAALGGLGETGTVADAPRVFSFISHPRTKVRRAALRALARLEGDAHVEAFLQSLADDRRSVSREAREALRPRVTRAGTARLWTVFTDDPRPHVRRNALMLLSLTGKWESIPLLVRAAMDADPALSSQAQEHLRTWLARYNHSFVVPRPGQLDALAQAVEAAGEALPEQTTAELRFLAGRREIND